MARPDALDRVVAAEAAEPEEVHPVRLLVLAAFLGEEVVFEAAAAELEGEEAPGARNVRAPEGGFGVAVAHRAVGADEVDVEGGRVFRELEFSMVLEQGLLRVVDDFPVDAVFAVGGVAGVEGEAEARRFGAREDAVGARGGGGDDGHGREGRGRLRRRGLEGEVAGHADLGAVPEQRAAGEAGAHGGGEGGGTAGRLEAVHLPNLEGAAVRADDPDVGPVVAEAAVEAEAMLAPRAARGQGVLDAEQEVGDADGVLREAEAERVGGSLVGFLGGLLRVEDRQRDGVVAEFEAQAGQFGGREHGRGLVLDRIEQIVDVADVRLAFAHFDRVRRGLGEVPEQHDLLALEQPAAVEQDAASGGDLHRAVPVDRGLVGGGVDFPLDGVAVLQPHHRVADIADRRLGEAVQGQGDAGGQGGADGVFHLHSLFGVDLRPRNPTRNLERFEMPGNNFPKNYTIAYPNSRQASNGIFPVYLG